jgi:predicted nucleotide-binding protein
VLLTSEDVGSLGSVEQHAELQARARQNVVFEMGFFFGLLGQRRVCAIYDAGVETPSDLGGILYVPYDVPSGKWRYDVAKEIRAAGYDVDLNRLYGFRPVSMQRPTAASNREFAEYSAISVCTKLML